MQYVAGWGEREAGEEIIPPSKETQGIAEKIVNAKQCFISTMLLQLQQNWKSEVIPILKNEKIMGQNLYTQ